MIGCFSRCFQGTLASELASSTNPSATRAKESTQQASTRPLPLPSTTVVREPSPARLKAQDDTSSLNEAISSVLLHLCNISGDHSLYTRIGLLLQACRDQLGAYDVRLAFFSADGATWVFLPPTSAAPHATPAAAGWGYTPLHQLLSDNPNSIVLLRDYHSTSPRPRQAPRPDGDLPPRTLLSIDAAADAAATFPAATAVDGVADAVTTTTGAAAATAAAPHRLLDEADGAAVSFELPSDESAASGVGEDQGQPLPCRTSPPDSASLACRTTSEPVHLQPSDLLALPVRLEGRVAAALLVGWGRQPAGAGAASTAPATATAPGISSLRSLLLSRLGKDGLGRGGGAATAAAVQSAAVVAAAAGLEADPGVLVQLQRVAQFVGFGLMCDSQHRRTLTQVAARFSLLPFAAGLHDLVTGLLSGVSELLHIRFTVRLQPILLLTHGLSTGGPAVLFSARHSSQQPNPQQQQQQPTTGGASQDLWSIGPGGGGSGGGGGGGSGLPPSSNLLMGLPQERANDVAGGEGTSRVRAVRISLHHTLLAEALRSASKLAAATPTTTNPLRRSNGNGVAKSSGGGAAAAAAACSAGGEQFGVAHGASSRYHCQGIMTPGSELSYFKPPSAAATFTTTAAAAAVPNGEWATAAAATAATTIACAPSPPPSPPIHTTIVTNIAAHMLEEGAPCRDLLLCSNLAISGTKGTAGSLILAVEAPAPTPLGSGGGGAGSGASSMRRAASQLSATVSGGGGGICASAPEVGRRAHSSHMAAAAAAVAMTATAATRSTAVSRLSALSQPLAVLHSQRQFGMYVVCDEVLPKGVLAEVAAELKQLLGMALGACRGGTLSMLGCGRCGSELYSMQQQLLGVSLRNSGGGGGSTGGGSCGGGGGGGWASLSQSLASAIAAVNAASASATVLQGSPRSLAASAVASPPRVPLEMGVRYLMPAAAGPVAGGGGCAVGWSSSEGAAAAVGAAAGVLRPPPLGLKGAQGRALPRSFLAAALAAANSHNLTAGGAHSAACPRLPSSRMMLQERAATHGSEAHDLESPAAAGGMLLAPASSSWAMASSPEVMLEATATGPSPLEVMVTSMRSGLTAAMTDAVGTDRGDEARAELSQELAALRLYDVIGRGGQGVVFYGTLHGLEAAVKVIVHRGKEEPLAHDGGDTEAGLDGEGAGGGQAAAAVAAGGAAGAEDAGGGEGNGDMSRIRKAKRGALELVVTSALSHPNIVQVLASFSDVVMVRCTYRNDPDPRLRLVTKDDPVLASWDTPGPLNTVACLEYCDGGTLLEAAHSGAFRQPGSSVLTGAVRPALVPLYTSLLEVALALRYLHSRRLVHCDLKPANVLLKSSTRDPRGWTCKLSDFGCVRLLTDLPVTPEDLQRHFAQSQKTHGSLPPAGQQQQQPETVLGFRVAQPLGTITYMAPESFIRGHTLGASIDIYAFGVLMYELLMCRTPYAGIAAQTLPRMVLRQHLRPEFHPLAPPEYCHLAARCWSSHVSRRPTAVQLVNEVEALLVAVQLKDSLKSQRASTAVAASVPAAAAAGGGMRPREEAS